MPVTFWTMTVALGSLAGVPPLAGWFSKESVLGAADRAARGEAGVAAWTGWLVLAVGVVTVAVTAAYVVRLWARTFLGERRFDGAAHEAPALMRWPLLVLAVPAALLGVLGLSASWLPSWMFPAGTVTGGSDDAPWVVAALRPEPLTVALSLAALLVGGGLAWAAWRRSPAADPADRLGPARPVLMDGFGVDAAYHALAVVPFGWAVRAVRLVDDRVVVPTVQGAGRAAVRAGAGVQRLQRGDVQQYLTATATFVIAAVVLVVVTVAT
jgi:NADH-quinone oxidoreductase subunit L